MSQNPENNPNPNSNPKPSIDELEEVIVHKAKEVSQEVGKGFENMTKSIKSKTENLDANLKPVMEELDVMKQNFQKQIQTPIGTKILVAILTGLLTGLIIWIVMSFVAQNPNPGVVSWIIGIILLQIADSLSGFSTHVQRIFTRLLQDNK